MKQLKSKFFFFGLFLFCMQYAYCDNKYNYPFQNPNLSFEKRAADLVSRLTLEEKVSQMLFAAPAIERFGVTNYNWMSDCIHGAGEEYHDYGPTVYPQVIGMAAGWDADAVKTMGLYSAEEGRAIFEMSQQKRDYRWNRGVTYWSPNINIVRDPRWGRGQETFGEDPYLMSVLGTNFVTGIQGNGKYMMGAACAKHFAVHSGPETRRRWLQFSVSDYDLWDTYLPAFKALADVDIAGFMCAYNVLDGQPCCANDKLMNEILRNNWKFTGYVTSDCEALEDFYTTQKTHLDAMSAAVDAINHGVDMDCWGRTLSELVGAVKQGKVTEEQIDISVRRLFEIRFRLGMFDPKELTSFAYIDSTVISNKQHEAHALKMAKQSMVLLKNDGTLPLRKESLKKVAVVGPNVDNPLVQLGEYNGFPRKIITPLEGLKEKLNGVEIVYEQGCGHTNNDFPLDINLKDHIVSPNGFSVKFYNNTNLEGPPVYQGFTPEINFLSGLEGNPVAQGVNLTNFSSRFEGVLLAPVSGTIEFTVRFDDGYRFYVNDKIVSAQWNTRTQSSIICRIEVKKGDKYALKLEQVQWGGGALIGLDGRFMERRPAQAVAEKVKDADVIIFVGGITPTLEREEIFDGIDRSAKDKVTLFDPPGFYGGDRTSILLPRIQTNLLKELKATGKPVILVLMSGSTIAVPWESENINAIVEAWYGGQSAGTAIADVLFGDYNPSGHLPVTCYASDSDLPDFEDYNMADRTYKYFKGKALYPFGFGLSYTDFAYNWTSQPKKTYKTGDTVTCTVKVKNTGKTDGDAVSQVYIKYPDGKGFPLKELRFFERKTISKGGNYQMKVKVPVEQLAKWDEKAGKLLVPTGKYTLFIGTNSEDEAVNAPFEIVETK